MVLGGPVLCFLLSGGWWRCVMLLVKILLFLVKSWLVALCNDFGEVVVGGAVQ